MALPVMEFIRRFLQHVLPSGFVKVRHYGLHHPSRKRTLSLVRAMLCLLRGEPLPEAPEPEEPCRRRAARTATSPWSGANAPGDPSPTS